MTEHELPVERSSNEPLSPAGRQRRERMLEDLIGEMRQSRSVRRRTALLAAPAALALAIILILRLGLPFAPRPSDGPLAVRERGGTPEALPPRTPTSAAIITIVQTRPYAVDHYRASTSPRTAERISDSELLSALAFINRPSGLVRSGERVWLTRDVTDPQSAAEPSNSS